MPAGELYALVSAKRKADRKELILRSISGEELTLHVSPFAYFDRDSDVIEVVRSGKRCVTRIRKRLLTPDSGVEWVDVFPYYCKRETLKLTSELSIDIVFKEITTQQEFEELRYLEQFHYLKAKPAWGRQAYLVAKPIRRVAVGTALPPVLGCAVLTSPSLFSGPRNSLLDWNEREVLTQNIDKVVRIARVIVHPEFRGLGIGSQIVRHCIEYSAGRWNVKGKRACVVEAVAEMSRYHPFFERGGLSFVGFTRRQQVVQYWGSRPKELGIKQGKGHVMASLLRFKQRTHSAKPYLMASLLADDHPISRAIAETSKHLVTAFSPITLKPLVEPIVLEGVSVTYPSQNLWDSAKVVHRKWRAGSDLAAGDLTALSEALEQVLTDIASTTETLEGLNRNKAHLLGLVRRMRRNLHRYSGGLRSAREGFTKRLHRLTGFLETISDQRVHLDHAVQVCLHQLETKLRELNGSVERSSSEKGKLNDLRLTLLELQRRLQLGSASSSQRWVLDAFGVDGNQRTHVFSDLNLEIQPGSIVLVVGPSGSGKTTFLQILKGGLPVERGRVEPAGIAGSTACLDLDFDPSIPLIDLVAGNTEEAVFFLNLAGLGEAHLYLKRRDHLSHGQRYRAAFARMLASGQPVWLADEFCAFLDPISTLILCKGVRKLVRRYGITFIAATAREDYIRQALEPDLIVRVNSGGTVDPAPRVVSWPKPPEPSHILEIMRLEPEALSASQRRWFEKVGLLVNDPHGLCCSVWSDRARLITAGDENLARYLWSQDWVFHRIWNSTQRSNGPPRLDTAKSFFKLDWSLTHTQTQLRYRQELAAFFHGIKQGG